jgi:RNA polymerase sigma factor (sigma-70 family)
LNQLELITKLKEGDESAFKILVETWQDMVYNTALGIVQNAEDAEDVTQEVFIEVYESVHSFLGKSKLSTWLYRITITKSLDHEKRKKRKKRFAFISGIINDQKEENIHPPDFDHPGILFENKEKAVKLFKALKQIPDKQRIAFTLHKLEGLSYQEISEIMNTTLYAVESLIGRAKNNLRKELEQFYLKK